MCASGQRGVHGVRDQPLNSDTNGLPNAIWFSGDTAYIGQEAPCQRCRHEYQGRSRPWRHPAHHERKDVSRILKELGAEILVPHVEAWGHFTENARNWQGRLRSGIADKVCWLELGERKESSNESNGLRRMHFIPGRYLACSLEPIHRCMISSPFNKEYYLHPVFCMLDLNIKSSTSQSRKSPKRRRIIHPGKCPKLIYQPSQPISPETSKSA